MKVYRNIWKLSWCSACLLQWIVYLGLCVACLCLCGVEAVYPAVLYSGFYSFLISLSLFLLCFLAAYNLFTSVDNIFETSACVLVRRSAIDGVCGIIDIYQ